MRLSFAGGVRVFDTAKVYGTEPLFKKWFEQAPEVRKQIFLVTKDMAAGPPRCSRWSTSGWPPWGPTTSTSSSSTAWATSTRSTRRSTWSRARSSRRRAEAIRKSGKAKFIGFSTHHKDRAPIIQAAAEGGIVDAIMLQYTPGSTRIRRSTRRSTPAGSKGIGLISMKQIAGHRFGDKPKGDILKDVVQKVPMLAETKLTPFQGLLHAIWTDERISCVCTSMRNTDQIRENADAARRFEPLKTADIHQLRDAMLAAGPTLCADCDGRCSVAAGTKAELGNLTRFLTYHEHHGDRAEAAASTPSSPPKPATGPAPTSRPPATPARTGSTSPGSCPRWIGTWPESIV